MKKITLFLIALFFFGSVYTRSHSLKEILQKPTSADNTVTGEKDTDYIFKLADFPYTDKGGGGLLSVKITSLPGTGTLKLSGTAVVANDVILVADIPNLTFTPLTGESGTPYTTFDFRVTDADGTSNPAKTITVNINNPPTAANNTVTASEDVLYVYALADFNSAYNDTDGDAFDGVKITSLETAGTLFLDANTNGTNDAEDITLDQEVPLSDVTKIKFIADPDQNGASYAQFLFKVYDSKSYSVNNYTITVDVTAVNDEPTSANNSVTTNESTDNVFVLADFSYSDTESDNFDQIETTTVPVIGTLWIDTDGNGVANEGALADLGTVSAADITANILKYKPVANANGSPYTTFTFKVHDGSDFSTAAYTMTINVNAVNTEPSFTSGGNQSVAEDAGSQTVVGWGAPVDPGTNEAAQTVTFQVSNDNNPLFSAQPSINSSGDLTYTPAADANGTVTVTVYVTEDGGTVNGGDDTSPSQTFNITITSVDDDPTINNQTLNIDENSPDAAIVGTVVANDIDGDALTYTITAGNAGGQFAINPGNGQITLNNLPGVDYETTTSYPLTVEVADAAPPTASATVTVNINNLNDNSPTVGGGPFTIDENLPVASSVGTVTSNDADGDALSFSVTTGNTGGAFDINSPSGEIVVANSDAVDFETNNSFNLTIEVSDGTFTANNVITINLNDINDAPEFTSNPPTYVGVSNLYTYTATASDDDLDLVTLSGVTIPGWLTFTPATGVLTGSTAISGSYPVEISASDGSLSTSQLFTIEVADNIINVPAGTSIRTGIDAAADGDIVIVADNPGVPYNENILINKNITVIGNSGDPTKTEIRGTGGSVVTFSSGLTNAGIKGFKITNGTGKTVDLSGNDLLSPNANYGGGLYCVNATATLENLIVSNNSTSVVSNKGGSGGGLYIGQNSNVTIKNSTIENNTSAQYRGGGLCIDNSTVTIENTDIQNNSGGNYGGGLSVWNSTLTLTDVDITSNNVTGNNGLGGGMFVFDTNQTLTNVLVSGNSASKKGNGVYSQGSSVTGLYTGGDSKIIIP